MNSKNILFAVCLSGFLAVALGAFGAHGLKPYLNDYQRMIFEKAVSYQFYHSLAALLAILLFELKGNRLMLTSAIFFLTGIFFFSGSLYLLATADMTGFPRGIAGPLTPVGGLFFLGGWGILAFSALKNSSVSNI